MSPSFHPALLPQEMDDKKTVIFVGSLPHLSAEPLTVPLRWPVGKGISSGRLALGLSCALTRLGVVIQSLHKKKENSGVGGNHADEGKSGNAKNSSGRTVFVSREDVSGLRSHRSDGKNDKGVGVESSTSERTFGAGKIYTSLSPLLHPLSDEGG